MKTKKVTAQLPLPTRIILLASAACNFFVTVLVVKYYLL